MSRVTCHVSRVMCHVSRVTCHMSHVFFFVFFDKLVELIGGGSVINGATPSSLFSIQDFSMTPTGDYMVMDRTNVQCKLVNVRDKYFIRI